MSSSKIIPGDIEKFYGYITATDDCQKSIDTNGFTIYPYDANGKIDFQNKEAQKKIVNQPARRRWDWTDAESAMWSQFRNEYESLYRKYEPAGKAEKPQMKEQLEQVIGNCLTYESEHQLLDRLAYGRYTNQAQMRLFGVKQHLLEYKTSFRTIYIYHDESLPFSAIENEFIEKYVALHERTAEALKRIKKLQADIKTLGTKLPALWQEFPVIKDKADTAANKIFIPPPAMKGAFSEMVSVYFPTPEESQQRADDFNDHYEKFTEEVTALCNRGNELYDEVLWSGSFLEDDDEGEYHTLFKETEDVKHRLYENFKCSIEVLALHDEYDNFLGSLKKLHEEEEKASNDWGKFVAGQSLFINVYNVVVRFLGDQFNSDDAKTETQLNKPGNSNPGETDDPSTETINRYESDLNLNTTNYYDVTDWHIIMDHYRSKFDNKNKAQALERAMTQHPNDATLLIRQAQEEASEHRYQKALSLIKEAEAQGPPHHPNLYYTKADIYVQLQTPEPAIPIYKKLIAQKSKELAWWRTHSYDCLLDIYEKQKNYDECIRLSLEHIAEEPDNESPMSDLARFYHLSNHSEEAEQPLKAFLEKHPQSAICHERLGFAYHDLKQYEKAIEQFDLAFICDKQEHYGALFYKGNALMELKRFDEAIVCFELCLLYYKLNKDCHLRAAQCYSLLNLQPLATAHYRKALAIDRDCKEALDALMLLQKQQ